MTAPVLRATGLVKRFGGLTAVDHVDLDVRAGEVRGLIGPNGSGKTTLINLLSGVYACDDGDVMLDGRRVDRMPRHRRSRSAVARTFQGIRLFGSMTVAENVRVAVQHRGRRVTDARTVTRNLLELVGIADLASWPANTLPYGDQRLVEIARALALNPQVLLLDEPVAGMAPDEIAQVGEIIRHVIGTGVGVLLVEHEMDFVLSICDRIAVLNFGRLIADDEPGVIRSHPEVVRAYLGESDAEGDLLGSA